LSNSQFRSSRSLPCVKTSGRSSSLLNENCHSFAFASSGRGNERGGAIPGNEQSSTVRLFTESGNYAAQA
jgi:hypothetical protein